MLSLYLDGIFGRQQSFPIVVRKEFPDLARIPGRHHVHIPAVPVCYR